MTTKYEEYGVLQSIIINWTKYSFKEYSITSDIFKYRCLIRACNCFIKIKKEEINKLSLDNPNSNITYSIFNEHNIETIKVLNYLYPKLKLNLQKI